MSQEINGFKCLIDIKNDNLYTYNWPGNVRELRNLVEELQFYHPMKVNKR